MSSQEYNEDQIESYESLEAVRQLPGMYIGSTNEDGLHHMAYEIIDNSVDEAIAGHCDKIIVRIHNDNSISVEDNGRGIPVGDKDGEPAINKILTGLHVGGKFNQDAYKVSGGLHGVGVSVVNALSTSLVATVKRDGFVWEQKFDKGEPQGLVKGRELKTDEDTGTKIRFWPDNEIFETTDFTFDTLRGRLENMAYLNPEIRTIITDERNEDIKREEYYFENGISEFIEHLNEGREPLHRDIIRMQGEETTEEGDNISVDIAMQYTTGTQKSDDSIFSFANNIETPHGGTHETGFKIAVTRVINSYAVDNNMFSDIEVDRISGSLVREGLTAVISIMHSDPQFEGQTKGKFGNRNARSVVSGIVSEYLEQFLEEHPDIAERIIYKIIEAYEAQQAAKQAEKLTRKSATTNTTLPGKLSDCQKGTPASDAELFIVEGDSAGGSAKLARNPETQAVLPLRGKILNVEKNRLDKILEHDQIRNIITALGTGIDDEFNIDDIRYETIILFLDADVDGAHIKTLILAFIFRHMPELLKEGYVYAAKPPLYRIRYKGETYDAMTDQERDEIVENVCNGNPDKIQRFKGLGEMNPDQLWETTMNPDNRILEQITIQDAIKADKMFSVLLGSKVQPRKKFIQENATEAEWIDI